METGLLCAFNVTRTALLSEKITHADANLTALQILGQLMHGPGADRNVGITIDMVSIGRIPRFFAFDVVYLDETLRVLTVSSVDPATDFPPVPVETRTALLLPEGRIASTGTARGDEVRLCEATELTALVKAASLPAISPPTVQPAPAPAVPAPAPAVPVQTLSFEVIRPSAFVFEPFLNSLIYSPPLASSNASASEFFLPQPELPAEPPQATEPAPAEAPLADSLVADSPIADLPSPAPSFAPPNQIARALDRPAAPKRPRPKKAPKTPAPQETEPDAPRFHQPKPIRFFDPVAESGQAQSGAEAGVPQEPLPPRPSNQLSPELKAAILQIDEQRRRQRSAGKDGIRKKSEREPEPERPTAAPLVPSPADFPDSNAPPALAEPEPAALAAMPPETQPLDASSLSLDAHTPAPIADVPAAARRPAQEPGADATPYEPISVSAPDPLLLPEIEFAPTVSIADEQVLSPSTPAFAASGSSVERPVPSQESEPAITRAAQIAREPAAPPVERQRPTRSAKPLSTVSESPISEPARKAAKPKERKSKLSFAARVSQWLDGSPLILDGQRRAKRHTLPGLVAFYWTGGTPRPHEIVNISTAGFYIRTRELWSPNTLLRMTLQRNNPDSQAQESLSILARVVRIDDEGVGHEFVSNEALLALHHRDLLPEHGTDIKALESFLKVQ